MVHQGIRRIGLGLLVWILVSIALLESIGHLTYQRVFVAALLGFLALRELVAFHHVPAQWRTRLNWILGASLVVFAVLIAQQIVALV